METALLNYFVLDNELCNTCDFNPDLLKKGKLVYEVIRVIDGKPLFFEAHLDRFFRSAHLSGLTLPLGRLSIMHRIKVFIEANKLVFGNIEFLFHFDESDHQRFMAWVSPFYYPSEQLYKKGVGVSVIKAVRKKPNAKAFNRSLREEADKIIAEKKVYEVLLKNEEGFLTEGSRSNLFFIKKGALFSPPVSKVLPGITRTKIFELSKYHDIEVNECDILASDISQFETCFLTGTSPKILPVHAIDSVQYPVDNKLLRLLMHCFDEAVQTYLKQFDFAAIS